MRSPKDEGKKKGGGTGKNFTPEGTGISFDNVKTGKSSLLKKKGGKRGEKS